jgi:hypothetical protein
LGERLNGIQEVGGSIPPGSTNKYKGLKEKVPPFWGALLVGVTSGVTNAAFRDMDEA